MEKLIDFLSDNWRLVINVVLIFLTFFNLLLFIILMGLYMFFNIDLVYFAFICMGGCISAAITATWYDKDE